MGIKVTSTPKKQFAVAALTVEGTSRKAVGAACLAMKRTILAGAPARLRGAGKSGARLGVRYDVKEFGDPVGLVRATGPWQLIESDTRAHLIVSKKLGGTRARRASLDTGLFVRAAGNRVTTTRRGTHGAVLTPYGPRAYVRHPGTKGKHPWAKGVERGTPAATLAFTNTVRADLKRQFG